MLRDERLAAIRARAERATPGPWDTEIEWSRTAPTVVTVYAWRPHREGLHRYLIACTEYGEEPPPDDLQVVVDNYAFVAAARQDVSDLLAEVEWLRAEVERLREEVDQLIVPTVTIEWAKEAGRE